MSQSVLSSSDRGSVLLLACQCLSELFGRASTSSNEILSLSLSPECHRYHPLISRHSHPFILWRCPLIRGSLPSCLLYQRDLHLKKPMVPPLYSMLACSRTNRPWPTCSFSSRLPSYHQVSLLLFVCGRYPNATGCQITLSGIITGRPIDCVVLSLLS